MPPDLHLDPDAVDGLAGLADRIATDLDRAMPVGPSGADTTETVVASVRRAAAELVVFAWAARCAARLVRETDGDAVDLFRQWDGRR